MKLIPKSIARQLAKASSENDEPIVRLFTSWGWEILLTSEKQGLLFGFVDLKMGCVEFGCVGTEESLKAIRGPLGLGIERDLHWTPPSKARL